MNRLYDVIRGKFQFDVLSVVKRILIFSSSQPASFFEKIKTSYCETMENFNDYNNHLDSLMLPEKAVRYFALSVVKHKLLYLGTVIKT